MAVKGKESRCGKLLESDSRRQRRGRGRREGEGEGADEVEGGGGPAGSRAEAAGLQLWDMGTGEGAVGSCVPPGLVSVAALHVPLVAMEGDMRGIDTNRGSRLPVINPFHSHSSTPPPTPGEGARASHAHVSREAGLRAVPSPGLLVRAGPPPPGRRIFGRVGVRALRLVL